ncbi:MAG: hypothetical protein ACRBN8_27435 [Nannocystales bacterium]
MLRRHAKQVVLSFTSLVLAASCSDADLEGSGGPTEDVEDEAASDTESDAGPSDEACVGAGGDFGILATHSLSGELSGAEGRLSAPGLILGPDGLWASLVAAEGTDASGPVGVEMLLAHDGAVLQPTDLVDGRWAGGMWWPGVTGAVVSQCEDRVPGWTFVGPLGVPLSPRDDPGEASACGQPPSAAWVSESSALLAWLDTDVRCETGPSCVRVTRANSQGHGPIYDLFDGGDSGPGNSVSVAAGAESAMVAMLRLEEQVELVTQPLDLEGNPTAAPTVAVLPPSPEPGESAVFLEARVVAEQDGSFHVYVGGWGFSMGRMHVAADGEPLEPVTALPPVVGLNVWGVYNSELRGVYPRPGGWVAVGQAVMGGQVLTLLCALSYEGELVGHVVLPRYDVAVVADAERLWALGVSGGVDLYELGCVPP